MRPPPFPPGEADRLRRLRELRILDTPPDERFDAIALLATQITNTPVALITLVDAERQWFKARIGFEPAETPRDISFCAHAIAGDDGLMIVGDAHADERFAGNPLVVDDPFIRFYAGAPLVTQDGQRLGTLCVIDRKPRSLDGEQCLALRALADQVVAKIELESALRALEESEQRWRAILDAVPVGVFVLDVNGTPIYANPKSDELLEKRLTSTSPEELAVTYPSFIAGTNERYPADQMPIVRALRGERTRVDDIELRTASGSRVIEVFGTPGVDSNGKVAYAVAAFSDVTGRRRLERALARESQFVKLLQSVVVAANEATSFEDAMQRATTLVRDLTGWPISHCWIVSPEDPESLVRLGGRARIRRGEGLPGRVAATAEPAWILDTEHDADFVRSRHMQPAGVRAAFAFPVLDRDEVFAVLEFFANDPRAPEDDLLEIMRHVGQQLGRVTQRMRAEAALVASEQEFRDLVENSLDLICTHDLQGRLLMVNRAAVESLGYDSPDQLVGTNLRDLLPPEIQPVFEAYMTRVISEGRDEGFMNVLRRDGQKRAWEYRNSLRYTPGAQIVRGVARDVTERLRAEHMLAQSEARYRLLFDRNLAAVCRTTASGKMLEVNDAAVRLFGYDSRDELREANAADLYPDAEARAEYLKRLTTSGSLVNIQIRLRRKDGSQFWALLSASLIPDRPGRDPFIEATLLDITERVEAEERTAYQATHDALTGLPNRILFDDRLQQAMAMADRLKSRVAIGFIDLDRFKPVNDEFGHAAGDFVLREAGARMQRAVRQSDTVARAGGDEFVIMITGAHDREDAALTMSKVAAAIREPIDFGGKTIAVEASIGISVYPDDASDGESLIRIADQAMYRAKTIKSAPPRSG